jgi:tetratricopeptide (TPR) repeat protein
MFIFEALVTYIPLMLVIAFVGMFGPELKWKILDNQKFKTVLFIIFIIFLVPSLYFFIIKPLNANKDFIKVMSSQNASFNQKIAAYEEVFSRNTLGNQEYRKYYVEYFISSLSEWINSNTAQSEISVSEMTKITNGVEQQVEKQLSENSHSVANYLLAVRFYDIASALDSAKLQKAVDAFNKAKELSPGRPQVYYVGANNYFYLSSYYDYKQETDNADKAIQTALGLIYDGAKLNYYPATAFDELMSSLNSVKGNNRVVGIMVNKGFGENKISDVAGQLITWLNDASWDESKKSEMKSELVDFMQILVSADPNNSQLVSHLASLKTN